MNKPRPVQKGLLFLMRVTLIHILISSFSIVMAHAIDGLGQEILDRKITLNVEGTEFQDVLVLISKQAKVKFAYSPEIVEEGKMVSLNVQNIRLEDVLLNLLGPEVAFKVIGKQIVLMPLSELKTLEEKERTNSKLIPVLKKITGKVIDGTGSPVPGVNVVVKGTTKGTVTDSNGVYSLDAPDGDVILVFSFIGYATQEIAVDGRATVDVTLEDDIQSLGEVIVVGYGTQEKKEVTGAITQVSGNEIRKSSAVSISNSLAGQVPGLFVNQTNAEPGRDDASIYVRGIGTTGNSAALIVVDGIANRDAISRIDPNDIESITVLKDASAAIYGAQAANGVILITTKKGKSGKPTITYSFNQGFVSPTRKLKLANAALYAKSVNIWSASTGGPIKFTDDQIADYESGALPSTNWINEVYRSNYSQSRHSLTLNGGSENVTYFLSAGATKQDGLVTGDETSHYKQFNIRSNVEAQVSEQLKIGLSIAGRREDRRWLQYEDQTIYSNTVRAIPTIPATIYGLPAEGRQGFNPLAIAQGPGYLSLIRNVFNGTMTGEYKIKQVKGLSVDGFAAIDITQDFEKHFNQPYTYYTDTNDDGVPEAVQGGPSLSGTYLRQDYVSSQSVTLNAKIRYERTFGVHSVAGFLAYEQNESKGDDFYAQRNQYTSSQIDQLFAGSANTDYFGIDGGAYETARQNYFGRANYTYNDRYMAQVHFRYDGSSNFPSNKRFGFFPGLSVGWRISEESFLKNSEIVSNLKLRASWGKLGNDRINPFQYLNTLSYPASPSQGYVIDGGNVNVLNPGVAANPNITWETKTTIDVGVDAGFFEDRLTFEFDVFSENRKNILAYRNATVPNYTGLTLPMENIAEVDNKGFDAQVMYRGKVSDVSFNVGGNMSFAKNNIVFSDERGLYSTKEQYERQSTEGHPVGARLVYDYIGIYRTAEDLTTYPGLTTPQLGDPIFRDINGDGVVNNLDRFRLDRTNIPQFQYGITLGAQYKGFDFTALFQGQARAIQFVRYTFNEGNNGLEYFLKNAWSPENPGASLPAFNQGNTDSEMSTLWKRDVSFLRLKNVEVGYTLPKNLVSKVGIEKLRLYVNGYNLLTFDKLKKDGLSDPEATNMEAWQFPHTKSINFGLNLTL